MLPHANIFDLNNNKNSVKFFLTRSLVSPTIKRVKCEVGWGPEIGEAGLKASAQIQVTQICVADYVSSLATNIWNSMPLPYVWEVTTLA